MAAKLYLAVLGTAILGDKWVNPPPKCCRSPSDGVYGTVSVTSRSYEEEPKLAIKWNGMTLKGTAQAPARLDT